DDDDALALGLYPGLQVGQFLLELAQFLLVGLAVELLLILLLRHDVPPAARPPTIRPTPPPRQPARCRGRRGQSPWSTDWRRYGGPSGRRPGTAGRPGSRWRS